MTKLDISAAQGFDRSRPRKLSSDDRLAIYALHREGVPAKVLSPIFGVNENSIRYITHNQHSAAHDNASRRYELIGKARALRDYVGAARLAEVNVAMRRALAEPLEVA
jgi:hypothetical protein